MIPKKKNKKGWELLNMDAKTKEISKIITNARNQFDNATDEASTDSAIMQMTLADRMWTAYKRFVECEAEYNDFIGRLG